MSLADAWIFNLDEYLRPVRHAIRDSYAAFLRRHLIAPLGLASDRVRLLRGDARGSRCRMPLLRRGDRRLRRHRSVRSGPGLEWTHRLQRARRLVGAAHPRRPIGAIDTGAPKRVKSAATGGYRRTASPSEFAPCARRATYLLLIAGPHKQAARAALERGVQDPDWPVTSLLEHPGLTVIELCARRGRLR